MKDATKGRALNRADIESLVRIAEHWMHHDIDGRERYEADLECDKYAEESGCDVTSAREAFWMAWNGKDVEEIVGAKATLRVNHKGHNMKRLISSVQYKQVSKEALEYLIEVRKFKIMPTQNVNTAKFLESMRLWESGESDFDPRKVAFGWKKNKAFTLKEAITAQGSGHWLVIARPHIGRILILDQDDGAFKKGLKEGREVEIQRAMSKDECEAVTGARTYLGKYRTPHGYHHILTQAVDPEAAGNGAWKIGEFEGDVRCDRGYAVMYDGDALAALLQSEPLNPPKCDISGAIGKKSDPSLQYIDITEAEEPAPKPPLPCPTIEEIGEALSLAPGVGGEMVGGCFKCKEGATRFHASIKDHKPLFYCFKEGEGENSCNGVNDPATFAKIMEAVNNRGDGATVIAKVHRMVRRAPPEDVVGAELAEILAKHDDITEYQKAWVEWKVWNEWYPDAVLQSTIKREKEELNVKHKAQLTRGREDRARAAEEKSERDAEMKAVRESIGQTSIEPAPFEKGDLNAFPWCIEQMGRSFRYNVIKMRVEYQDGPNHPWRVPDDHEIDELFVDIGRRFVWQSDPTKPVHWGRGDQMTAYKGNVYRTKFNHWQEYVDTLPNWDGAPRIHQSMDMGGMTIEPSPISAWAQGVAWVDMVRNGLYPGSPRFSEAVLFGPGGRGKSSFLESMVPPDMRTSYFLEGGPPLDAEDKVQIEQGAFLLIEGKEFGGGAKRDWEKVKEMWDKRTYTARLAYGRTTSSHRRCDTRVHTTNRRQLPEDDTAVSRRLLAVKVKGKVKIEKRRGFKPWDWFDSIVDESMPERGTYRDQMFAEAKAIIAHHGGAHLEDGRWTCNFNYLEFMVPSVAHDPDALLKINQEAGIAYATEESSVRLAGSDALRWYKNAGLDSQLTSVAEDAGGVYDDGGRLVAIKPRGLFSMMFHIQSGHDDTTAAKLTAELLRQDLGDTAGGGTVAANAIDKESGITLALKRRFKGVVTGGDEPMVKEDENPSLEPHEGSGKRFRWFRPI